MESTDPRAKGLAILKEKFGLSSIEEEFLNGRYNANDMTTAARNISEFYVSKTIERAAKASERLSRRLIGFTAALVLIALAQLVAYSLYVFVF